MTSDLRDFIGKQIAYYDADKVRTTATVRREAQIIALAEVLRFMDGDMRMADGLVDIVPYTLDDLPRRLGGH